MGPPHYRFFSDFGLSQRDYSRMHSKGNVFLIHTVIDDCNGSESILFFQEFCNPGFEVGKRDRFLHYPEVRVF
jgi:hypothetical protein